MFENPVYSSKSTSSTYTYYSPDIDKEIYGNRALVVAGAEGATAPVKFEQRVHAPVNFQPFQF